MTTATETIDVQLPVSTACNQWTQYVSFQRFIGAGKSIEGTTHAGVVTSRRLTDESCPVTVHLDRQPDGVVEKGASTPGFDDRQVNCDLAPVQGLRRAPRPSLRRLARPDRAAVSAGPVAQNREPGGLAARHGRAEHPERPVAHPRPAGRSDDAVAALGKLSEALEVVEHARGLLYGFHRLCGTADLTLQQAVRMLHRAGYAALAEDVATVLIGRDIVPGWWSF